MLLTTRRLVLRELEASDWSAIHEYEADPMVQRYTLHGAQTAEEVQASLRRAVDEARAIPRQSFVLAVTLAGDGRLIGQCGLRRGQPEPRVAELWFVLNRRFWGQGYATEAMTSLVRHGFTELGLHRIYGDCDPRNLASARVMEKLGMVKEAHLRQNVFAHGEWCDSFIYALLRRDWELAAGG